MKRIALLITFLVCEFAILYAQPVMPDKCEVFYPEILQNNAVLPENEANALMASSDFGQNKAPRNKTFWVVYSDRDDNVTYTEPGGNTRYSTLSLNERLRIARIKNGYALVYKEPQEDIAYPLISQFKDCKGWISMKKLLLWHSALANDAGIYNKALLCVNLDEQFGSESGKLYRNPNDMSSFERLETNMQFYFVMKREGNLSLIAANHSTEGHSDIVLEGWVAEQSYVPWNQRSCVEPNWDHKDVEYFAAQNAKINIHSGKALDNCVTMLSFRKKDQTGQKYDKHLYRMKPDDLRFPLLDDGTETLYNCSTFGTAEGATDLTADQEGNESDMSPLGLSEQALQDMLNINIGIVIDGTASMEKFYPAVKEAIKEGSKFFGDKYKVKVGVCIYRDYGDGNEYMTEVFQLTNPTNPKLFQWLDSGGRYGIKSSSSDRTLEEAMYLGIDTALDRLGFRPEQSNLLLVVGDCGNDVNDTKISSDELVNKLVEKNVNIMGFQVRSGSEGAFALFNSQILDIMKKSLDIKYKKLYKDTFVKMLETNDGYILENDVKSNIYIGSHSYPLSGQEMSTGKLSTLMQESIMYCSDAVQVQINLMQAFNAGGFNRTKDNNVSATIDEAFIISRIGKEAYEQAKKNQSLMAFKGYAQKNHKSGRPYFKPVVFISSDELNSLIERLAPVNNAAVVQTNDREPYVKAMKALIQSMVPDITDDELNRKDVGEVMAIVSGLNEASTALKGYTIAQIANPQAVNHQQYASLVSDFKRKFELLRRLKQSEYKYVRTFNGMKYYWLPVEDLP